MSEKYTVNFYWSFENNIQIPKWEIREWQNLKHGEDCYIEYATLDSENSAELVCRLLNENEKRKSLPRIDKEIKKYIIESMENDIIYHSKKMDTFLERSSLYKFHAEDYNKLSRAKSFIESLECE